MIVIHFGLKGFKVERGSLFGRKENPPVLTIRLGLISIVVLNKDGSLLLRMTMEGLSTDSDWLLDNHHEIEKRLKQKMKETRDLALERQERYNEDLRNRLSEVSEHLTKRNTEAWHLKQAIKIVKETQG